MKNHTTEELEEALRAIRSTISKCEKVQPKLKQGSAQDTLLKRRIKAFQIAATLILDEMENQTTAESNPSGYMGEYKRLLQTTNLQKGYQEFVKTFRQLRTYLQKELPTYVFAGNIVENNMDYSYFQLTNDDLKSTGLKIVVAFVHADFELQIWLSGVNREVQTKYQMEFNEKQTDKHIIATDPASYPYPLELTQNPTKTDYIIRARLVDDWYEETLNETFHSARDNIAAFVNQVGRLISLAKMP